MQEYEHDARTFQNPNMEDGKLYAVFFMDTVKDEGASALANRPIFKDTEFVRIVAPGDKTNVVVRPAREDDRARFQRQYAAFKRGDAEQVVGTPLAQWPLITRAQVEEFKYLEIRTVEHLAAVRDDIKSRVPGMHELSQRAQQWLAAAKGEDTEQLKRENEELKTRLDRLEAMLVGNKPAGPGEDEDDEEEAVAAVAAPSVTTVSKPKGK